MFVRSDCPATDNDRFLCETLLHGGEVTLRRLNRARPAAAPGKADYFEELERVFARLSYAEGDAAQWMR